MASKKKILLVDDEKELVALVSFHIKMQGFNILSCDDGEKALELAKREKPDLIILDLMLPKIDGWEVCKRLREAEETKDIPVIMLTCRAEMEDKLKGFEVGADDYITKPFSPRELVARVKRVLERTTRKPTTPLKRYNFGNLEINFVDFVVKVRGKEIYLTKKEAEILKILVERANKLVTYEEIFDAVWGEDNIVEYANIDVHIRYLRKKLEEDPANPKIIKTIKGEGYKFEP